MYVCRDIKIVLTWNLKTFFRKVDNFKWLSIVRADTSVVYRKVIARISLDWTNCQENYRIYQKITSNASTRKNLLPATTPCGLFRQKCHLQSHHSKTKIKSKKNFLSLFRVRSYQMTIYKRLANTSFPCPIWPNLHFLKSTSWVHLSCPVRNSVPFLRMFFSSSNYYSSSKPLDANR